MFGKFGSVEKTTSSFVVRVRGQKRSFPFDASVEQDRQRASAESVSFLEDWNLKNKIVNTFVVENNVAKVSAFAEGTKFATKGEPFVFLVDESDISILADFVWWIRLRPNGRAMHVFSFQNQKRVLLHDFIAKSIGSAHNNGDVLDNRRLNIRIASSTSSATNSSSSTTSSLSTPVSVSLPHLARDALDSVDPRVKNLLTESFTRFIFKDGPHISAKDWTLMKNIAIAVSLRDKKMIAERLSQVFGQQYPTFPYPTYSTEELVDDASRLSQFDSKKDKNGKTFGLEELRTNKFGIAFCKNFMFDLMFDCPYRAENLKIRSGTEIWKDDAMRRRVFFSALSRASAVLTPTAIVSSLNYVFYLPINFPPVVAKQIYDRFCSKSGSRVLDFCSGWGGRLLGFWFCQNASFYCGIDPNKSLLHRYEQMRDFLMERFPDYRKKCEFYQFGAETEEAKVMLASKTKFDIVFTSPPYFDREIYVRNDKSQSCNRFPTYESWKTGFLFRAIEIAVSSLKKDGYLLLNVANTDRCETLVEDVCKYLTSGDLELLHLGSLSMPIMRRGTVLKEKSEPILIFRNCLQTKQNRENANKELFYDVSEGNDGAKNGKMQSKMQEDAKVEEEEETE